MRRSASRTKATAASDLPRGAEPARTRHSITHPPRRRALRPRDRAGAPPPGRPARSLRAPLPARRGHRRGLRRGPLVDGAAEVDARERAESEDECAPHVIDARAGRLPAQCEGHAYQRASRGVEGARGGGAVRRRHDVASPGALVHIVSTATAACGGAVRGRRLRRRSGATPPRRGRRRLARGRRCTSSIPRVWRWRRYDASTKRAARASESAVAGVGRGARLARGAEEDAGVNGVEAGGADVGVEGVAEPAQDVPRVRGGRRR